MTALVTPICYAVVVLMVICMAGCMIGCLRSRRGGKSGCCSAQDNDGARHNEAGSKR